MEADIQGRAAACKAYPGSVPAADDKRAHIDFGAQLRAKTVERDGKQFYELDGYASTVEQPYEMYDLFGPYTEVVDRAAFDKTLASNPDVKFLANHGGVTMARTKSGTLSLSVDDHGLRSIAYLRTDRSDIRDLVLAIEDGNVDQMSFAFRIVNGQWSPDYTEYRILQVDLDGGDVSAVNDPANPNTTIAARTKQALAAVDELPPVVLRELAERAQARLGGAEPGEPVIVGEQGPELVNLPSGTRVMPATPPVRAMSYAEAALRQAIA